MRAIVFPLTVGLACVLGRADVQILSTSRSVSGEVFLDIFETSDSDSQTFSTMDTGAFDAGVDILADPFPSNFIAAQVQQTSLVTPTRMEGVGSFGLQWGGVSSGNFSASIALSNTMLVEFEVTEATAYDFHGLVPESSLATIFWTGPGFEVFVQDAPGLNDVTQSGVLDPGVYTLDIAWAFEDPVFAPGQDSGSVSQTPWSFTLSIPAPGAPAALLLIGTLTLRRRR